MAEFTIPELSMTENPPVGFHFLVTFFIGGIVPNPLDLRFKKVSGISSEIEIISQKEGGENLYVHRLPNRVSYNNLTLERGMVIGSPLNIEFNVAMSSLRLNPGNVLVALLNDDSIPISAWLFLKTYPVKWMVSNLDATQNSVVIETMELAYTRFQSFRI
ncbi:MAG: phage tail protein [bacterium]